MKTYNVFLDYYDKIVRSVNNPIEEELDFLINDCLKKYLPNAHSILETACWTWVIARELIANWYKVTWLDISEEMLEKAKENIWEKNIVLWDMTNFDLKTNFDSILCNYNSICHLLSWQEWQNFFDMSFKHLKTWWILIFDINTIFEFENITRDFAQFYNYWDDTVCLEMFKQNWYYEWLVKIFKKSKDNKYDLIEEIIKENSFEINKIKKQLKEKWFEILDIIDYHYKEVNENSERVYFICKKIIN